MGFMDKAKQMADQAQQKIEDAQKQFNDGQAKGGQQGAAVRYDSNGRPIQEPPAAQSPPAPVAPADAGAPAPAQEAAAEQPAAETPQPAPEVKDGVNSAPDPFKPIE